jgi:hypothetical protein
VERRERHDDDPLRARDLDQRSRCLPSGRFAQRRTRGSAGRDGKRPTIHEADSAADRAAPVSDVDALACMTSNSFALRTANELTDAQAPDFEDPAAFLQERYVAAPLAAPRQRATRRGVSNRGVRCVAAPRHGATIRRYAKVLRDSATPFFVAGCVGLHWNDPFGVPAQVLESAI